MLAPAGPLASDEAVRWFVADPDGRLDGVRLWSDFDLGEVAFTRADEGWELEIPVERLPPVDRLEYLLEETSDGRTVLTTDPANARRVGGAFGDHSWVPLGYDPPAWLNVLPVTGTRTDIVVEGTPVGDVAVEIWSPAGTDTGEPLPLLLSHDGPEMDRLGELTRFVGAMIATDRLPPVRVGLIAPGPRDERYAANHAYAAALAQTVVPAVLAQAPSTSRPVLMGQSLGALAALHAEWRHPGTFAGLLLQSGSFFTPQLDGHESGFAHWERVTGFVAEVLGATRTPSTLPVGICFGTAEENAGNNRQLADALTRLGVAVEVGEVRDGHTWTCWRDLLEPCLLDVVGRGLLRQAQDTASTGSGSVRP